MFVKDVLSMYSKRILVVDDAKMFIAVVNDFFRREQVEILTASNGLEAVEIVKKNKPDLIFMDLYMPEMNGDEACRLIKSDSSSRSVPVVMMTGSNLPGDLKRCRDAGCNEIIGKPVQRDDFLKVCKKFITLPKWSGRRIALSLPVRFRLEDGMTETGRLRDISIGGVFLETERSLNLDEELQLEFKLSEHLPAIQCRGRVAWLNRSHHLRAGFPSPGVGIEFVHINKLDILTVQSWLKHEA